MADKYRCRSHLRTSLVLIRPTPLIRVTSPTIMDLPGPPFCEADHTVVFKSRVPTEEPPLRDRGARDPRFDPACPGVSWRNAVHDEGCRTCSRRVREYPRKGASKL